MDQKRAETLRAREAVKAALSALLDITADTQCKVSVKTHDGWTYELEQVNARNFVARSYSATRGGMVGIKTAQGAGESLDEALAALWVD